jgi:hypothetical protein
MSEISNLKSEIVRDHPQREAEKARRNWGQRYQKTERRPAPDLQSQPNHQPGESDNRKT